MTEAGELWVSGQCKLHSKNLCQNQRGLAVGGEQLSWQSACLEAHIHCMNPAQRHTLWKRVDEGRGWMKVKVGFEISLT